MYYTLFSKIITTILKHRDLNPLKINFILLNDSETNSEDNHVAHPKIFHWFTREVEDTNTKSRPNNRGY